MRYRITTVSLIAMLIVTVLQISLVSATSIVKWEANSSAWSKEVEDTEGQKQNTVERVLQASSPTVQPANLNASSSAKKKVIYLPLLSRGTTSHPANPNASEDTKKVLSYIASLPDRPDKRVISGQMLGHGEYAVSGYTNFVEALHAVTGEWVALVGADYGPWGNGTWVPDLGAANTPLIRHWQDGGLVTVSWHARNPWTGNSAWDLTDRDLVDLITPGTGVNGSWMADLDRIAAGLAELRDAGVVVLWRPFHEMTYTECFWWDAGAHPGDPEPFKDMWRHMFDYFTYDKGLNNLLWVYAPANTDNWSPVDALYPGADYVDIVGIDEYGDHIEFKGDGYSKLLALGKPFALTETGPYPTRDGSWDNANLISRIRNNYPQIAYFLYWYSWTGNAVAIVDNQNASGLLSDPWVITRDELDWGSEPTPTPTPSPTPTPTRTPTPTPTQTPLPTHTPTATDTPLPTYEPTPTSTSMPSPTNAPTSLPTDTPTSTPTNTPAPRNTPLPTNTPALPPTSTPTPTPTPDSVANSYANSDQQAAASKLNMSTRSFYKFSLLYNSSAT